MQNTKNPTDFLNRTKLHLYPDKIFCFAKDGKLLSMPKGSTVLDFAYNLNEKSAAHVVQAKINGVAATLHDPLVDGVQIELITSARSEPKAEWLSWVKTPYAKTCIEERLQEKKAEEIRVKGAAMLREYARKKHIHLDTKTLNDLAAQCRYNSTAELFSAVGSGTVRPHQVCEKVYARSQSSLFEKTLALFTRQSNKTLSPILGLDAKDVFVLANCCRPSMGNAIVGIRENHQVVIHRRECVHLSRYIKQPDKWVNVEWNITKQRRNSLPVRLQLVWKTGPKTMAEIVTLFAQNEVELCRISTLVQGPKKTEVMIDINVADEDQLLDVLDCLHKHPKIFSVFQVKGIK